MFALLAIDPRTVARSLLLSPGDREAHTEGVTPHPPSVTQTSEEARSHGREVRNEVRLARMPQRPESEAPEARSNEAGGRLTREIVDGSPALVSRNGPVTAIWREVEWSKEKRIRFAQLILKMAEAEEDEDKQGKRAT